MIPDGAAVGSVPSKVLTSRSAGRHRRGPKADRDARTPGDAAATAASPIYVDRGIVFDWFASVPGYRAELRRRVDEAAHVAETRANRIDAVHRDVDYLGQTTDGCG